MAWDWLQNLGNATTNGFNSLSTGLFPMDPTATQGMTPQQIQELRRNAMLRMGLGMMAAPRGATTGQAIAGGYMGASDDLMRSLQLGYQNAKQARQDQHALTREGIQDQRYDAEHEHAMEREGVADAQKDLERRDRLQQNAAEIKIAQQRLKQSSEVSPDVAAQLAFKQKGHDRAQFLMSLPKLSSRQEAELDDLLGGAISRQNRYPDFSQFGLGGQGGLGAGTSAWDYVAPRR